MYTAYKLNKQGDNIQPWHTPFPIWNQSVVPCPVLTVASWPAYRFLRRQVRWSGIPISFKDFPQFVVIHTVKGFGVVSKAEIDVFLELSCFFDDPADLGNLISGSSDFSKSSLNIWKFRVHILLKPGLENFEHYFARMWDECNFAVVWTFFGITFLWDWSENLPFPVLWPLLSFPNLLAYWVQHFTASSFRIWNTSTGIPSPPLALFTVMLPKAYLTSHSRMSGSPWVITPSWLSGSWRSFLYSSSVYSCHFFLISSASVRSIPFLCYIVPIFAWNVPLVSVIFFKRSLVFPILLFSSVSLHWSLRKAFFSLLAILWNSAFESVYLSFSPLPSVSLLFSTICKASSDSHFAFLHFFFLGMVLISTCCTMSWTAIHSSSGTLSDLIPWIYFSLPLYNHKGFYKLTWQNRRTCTHLLLRELQKQFAAEQLSTGACWIPPKKDTPHPRAKEKSQQDGRRGEIVFRLKPHTCQRHSEGSNKPCAHQDPETPQRLSQNGVYFLWRCGSAVEWCWGGGSKCSRSGYGISPLGEGCH